MPQKTNITIRNLRADELDLLQRNLPSSRRLLDGVSRTYHETRLEAQAQGDADYLIAWAGGVPAGHVFLRWSADKPFLRERNLAGQLVEALAVRSELQSQGIGTALMVESERIAIARGDTSIGLAVGIENARARALYLRLGYIERAGDEFRMTWTSMDDEGREREGGETCTYMAKLLLAPRADAAR